MSEAPAPKNGDTAPEARADEATTRALHSAPARRRPTRWMPGSRPLELVVSGILLVLLTPLLVTVAILVKVDGPGPVLCRQEREGRGGRTFQLVSFRTTTPGSEATRVGDTLRRYAIDEFPQLWNVFVGDMSLDVLWRNIQTLTRPVGTQ